LLSPSQDVLRALIDSGANCHLISEAAVEAMKIPVIKTINPITINTAEAGAVLSSCGYISLGVCLPCLYVVPRISQSILSVSLLQKANISTTFDSMENICTLKYLSNPLISCSQDSVSSLYFLDFRQLCQALSSCKVSTAIVQMLEDADHPPPAYLSTWYARVDRHLKLLNPEAKRKYSPLQLREMILKFFKMHRTLNHLHYAAMAIGIRDGYFTNTDLTYAQVMLIGKHVDCAACALAKWAWPKPGDGLSMHHVFPFYECSLDILGPYPPAVGGYQFVIVLICTSCGYGIGKLLKNSPTATDLMNFMDSVFAFAQRYGWSVNRLRVDAASLFTAKEFTDYLDNLHITLSPAPAEEQFRNPVERYIRTLKQTMNADHIAQCQLPASFWSFGLLFAITGLNLSPNTMGFDNRPPCLAVCGQLVDIPKQARFHFAELVVFKKTGEKLSPPQTRNEFGRIVMRGNPLTGSYLVLKLDDHSFIPVERAHLFSVTETDKSRNVLAGALGMDYLKKITDDGPKMVPITKIAISVQDTMKLYFRKTDYSLSDDEDQKVNVARLDSTFPTSHIESPDIPFIPSSRAQTEDFTEEQMENIHEFMKSSKDTISSYGYRVHGCEYDFQDDDEDSLPTSNTEDIPALISTEMDTESNIPSSSVVPPSTPPPLRRSGRTIHPPDYYNPSSSHIQANSSAIEPFMDMDLSHFTADYAYLLSHSVKMFNNTLLLADSTTYSTPEMRYVVFDASTVEAIDWCEKLGIFASIKPPAEPLDAITPTLGQARRSSLWPFWKQAIQKEMSTLDDKNTFEEVFEIPAGMFPIPTKFVLRKKPDKYKARLVALGNLDTWDGITFAPTASPLTMWLIFQLMTLFHLKSCSIDFTAAFVSHNITRDVIVKIGSGYYKLLKFLYGLDDSPKAFNDGITKYLLAGGFIQSKFDPCLFMKWPSPTEFIFFVLHVDDLAVVSTSTAHLQALIDYLSLQYEITHGPLDVYLGIHNTELPDGSRVFTRPGQLDKLFAQFPPEDTKRLPLTPMTADYDRNHHVESPPCNKLRYQTILGNLIQLLDVRPDIAYSVSRTAQCTAQCTERDMQALYRIIAYLYSTKHMGICLKRGHRYRANVLLLLQAFADASFASTIKGRSQLSHCLNLLTITNNPHEAIPVVDGSLSGMIFNKSYPQTSASLSSSDAEVCTTVDCIKTVVLVRSILDEMHFTQLYPTPIYNDNKSSITLTTAFSGKTKNVRHMLAKLNYAIDQVNDGVAKPVYLATDVIPPDIGTKALEGPTFRTKRTSILGWTEMAETLRDKKTKS